MIIGPLRRSGRDFDDALETARTGRVASEWLFSDQVLEALRDVATEPTEANVVAARHAWMRTSDLARTLHGVRAVVFDVGETLVDETRSWTEAAAAVGVTAFTLMGLLGALIERGADHREVWDALGVTPPPSSRIEPGDLYPDAIDCLRAARTAGLTVGIAGNQPDGAEAQLRAAGVQVDFTASSARWGVEKPSSTFFERIIAEAGGTADRVVHVGDRLDNDVLPARAAGLRTVLIRRGPWGHVHSGRPDADEADAVIDSLRELTEHLGSRRS